MADDEDAEKRGAAMAAVTGLTEIASKILDRLPFEQQRRVFCAYIFGVIAFLAVVFPPYSPIYKAFCIVFLVLAIWLILGGHRRSRQLRKSGTGILTPGATRKTFKAMDKARKTVGQELRSLGHSIADKNLRANVFIPVRDDGGLVQKLKIHPALTINMNREPERNIELGAEQGVTGLVFSTGQAQVAERIGDDAESRAVWNKVYQITPQVAELVHPELQWIMSMPLYDDDWKPVGVFNVDCLRKTVPHDQLNRVMVKRILPRVAAAGRVFTRGLR